MEQYDFLADFLNKFSQLTPWVQVILGLGIFASTLGIVYFIKEIVALVTASFKKSD